MNPHIDRLSEHLARNPDQPLPADLRRWLLHRIHRGDGSLRERRADLTAQRNELLRQAADLIRSGRSNWAVAGDLAKHAKRVTSRPPRNPGALDQLLMDADQILPIPSTQRQYLTILNEVRQAPRSRKAA